MREQFHHFATQAQPWCRGHFSSLWRTVWAVQNAKDFSSLEGGRYKKSSCSTVPGPWARCLHLYPIISVPGERYHHYPKCSGRTSKSYQSKSTLPKARTCSLFQINLSYTEQRLPREPWLQTPVTCSFLYQEGCSEPRTVSDQLTVNLPHNSL